LLKAVGLLDKKGNKKRYLAIIVYCFWNSYCLLGCNRSITKIVLIVWNSRITNQTIKKTKVSGPMPNSIIVLFHELNTIIYLPITSVYELVKISLRSLTRKVSQTFCFSLQLFFAVRWSLSVWSSLSMIRNPSILYFSLRSL